MALAMVKSQKNIPGLLKALHQIYPDVNCELEHASALELLVATILSAQCTDKRVNAVTKALFKKYVSAEDYSSADPLELEKDIHSCGFYRNKAKNIRAMAALLIKNHNGRVPDTMDLLTALPGVARKTANVILGTWFKKNDGVVVDTHVMRLSKRLGLSFKKTPEKIEDDLKEKIPREYWTWFSHAMICHGRRVCEARKPRCHECPVRALCPNPVS